MLSVVLFSVRGGIETYTAQLVNELAPIVRVAYAIDIKTKQQIGRLIDPRVTLIEYRRPRLREFWGIVEICRLAVKIKQFNPDLFHIQGDGVWESVLLRLLSNIPIVATVHDPIKHIDQRTHVNNWTMKDVVKRSRGWVLHSEGLKNIFIKLNKVNKDNVLIHPHGIYNFYCNYSPPSKNKEKFFLFFGELRINKGLDLFLEAFEMVTGQIPEWKVVIAGRGHFEQDKHLEFNRERIEFYNRYITNAEAASFFLKPE